MLTHSYRRGGIFLLFLGVVCGALGAAVPPEASEPPVGRSAPGDRRTDYVLQPQDSLRVFIFQHDDLNKQMDSVQVSPEYTISLPLVGTLSMRGLTARQAENAIRDAFDRDFLVNPQVSVVVVKYAERSVNVLGQVGKPDRVPFPQEKGLTIIEAITLAGGPTRLADLRRVKLTRKQPDGESVVEEIDVSAMMNKGGKDAVQLKTGDVIYVPERVI
jgi:protein involved in polysaccharide export with SLBB domain